MTALFYCRDRPMTVVIRDETERKKVLLTDCRLCSNYLKSLFKWIKNNERTCVCQYLDNKIRKYVWAMDS